MIHLFKGESYMFTFRRISIDPLLRKITLLGRNSVQLPFLKL